MGGGGDISTPGGLRLDFYASLCGGEPDERRASPTLVPKQGPLGRGQSGRVQPA